MKVAIISGSVYGTAEEVARHAANILNAAGFETLHNPRATLAGCSGLWSRRPSSR
jgi:MioC protein